MAKRKWPLGEAATWYFEFRRQGMPTWQAAMRVVNRMSEYHKMPTPESFERIMRREFPDGPMKGELEQQCVTDACVDVPEAVAESMPEMMTVFGHEPSLVLFDLHAPQHNERLLEAALSYAQRQGIKRVIAGGDTLNLGYFSSFPSRTKYTPEFTDREMVVVEGVFKALAQVFDDLIIFGGNHDQGRWARATDEKVGFHRLLRMVVGDLVDKMRISGRRYCQVETPLGLWHITHQAGKGRKRQLSSAEELAMLERKHVMMGHEHTLGIVKERTGRYWACNGGFMGDEAVMEYKTKDTTHTKWAPGFVELDDGGWVRLWPAEVIVPRVFFVQEMVVTKRGEG